MDCPGRFRRDRPGSSAVGIEGTLCALLLIGLGACGGGDGGGAEQAPPTAEQPAAGAGPASSSGYVAVGVDDGGSISGTIRFSGAVPPPRTIQVDQDPGTCGSSVELRDLAVGPDRGLADVVVSLTDITRGAALEVSSATLEQRGCRFHPHVIVMAVGAPLAIVNSDDVTHNVHTVTFDNRPFNRTQPPSLERIEASFDVAEKVGVKCDLHPWMNAWVVVVDHPYHAVTGADGRFSIDHIPAGTYTLEVWHEKLGARTVTVTVTAGQNSDASVELTQSSP